MVAKVSPLGVAQWVRALGYGADGSESWGGSIALDGVGHVYVDGSFQGTVDFDPGTDQHLLTSTSASHDGYVVKLHTTDGFFDPSDASPGWVAQISGTSLLGEQNKGRWNFGLAADATGVYAAGTFNGTLHFGGTVPDLVDQNSTWDGVLAKFNADGTAAWANQYIDAVPQGVAIDTNSVYTATSFVAKYGKDDGHEEWYKPWEVEPGGRYDDHVLDLQVQGGVLYLTGLFKSTVDFNLDPTAQYVLTAVGHTDMYVWKMTDEGGFLAAVRAGGASTGINPNDSGTGIAVDSQGNVVITGVFRGGPVDFDPGSGTATLTAFGSLDAFLLRLGSDMTYQGVFQLGSYDRTIDDGDPGYVESGTGWKDAQFYGAYNHDSRYHTKGKGANTASWTFNDMAPSGAATYDVFVSFFGKSNNASDAKYNVNGTIVSVNQRISPSGGWLKLGTFAADAQSKITVVLSDNANGNVIADAVHVVINAPAGASASAAAAAVAQPSNNAALMSAIDFWMSDLADQSTKRKQSSKTLDLLPAGIDPFA